MKYHKRIFENLKVGDVLLCKKTFKNPYDDDGKVIYKKFITVEGKYFEIEDMYHFYKNSKKVEVIVINDFDFSNRRKTLNKDILKIRYLQDYFYTKEEERKLKLNIINGI